MISVVYTKNDNTKHKKTLAFIREAMSGETGNIIYFCPKNKISHLKEMYTDEYPMLFVSYEDMTKKDIWLYINSVVDPKTIVILDMPARYYKVSSLKVRYLHKLCWSVSRKLIIDNVPYCEDIQYIYVPWSHLDRSILGYSHYYAFRENYDEKKADGTIVKAHDFENVSEKICKYVYQDYDSFSAHKHIVARAVSTKEERREYQELKKNLFSARKTISPIITGLADLANSHKTRTDLICDIINSESGKIAVVCNLFNYSKKIRKACGKKIICATYSKYDMSKADCVIYAESPIVQSYRYYDIESSLKEDTKVYNICGDQKVDEYLFNKLTSEINQINTFSETLKGVINASI